ncbi:MAG: hypothetical protein HeimC3_39490 [Candidatus Heimdallarchaeota archaeon LC_3]|nr:MAG: hypothetical protein HeimC3_39490 [Candidatus Heimdallarchaeota archaeon LC_3]
MNDAGSSWNKWDLHIHSPESFVQQYSFENRKKKDQYGGNIWDKFVDQLECLSEIKAIGITDYFSIEGYKKLLEYKSNGRLNNLEIILPNIEFRLDVLIPNHSQNPPKRLNYHVIFTNEINPQVIETEFLEQLHIQDANGEDRPLKREIIEEIGERLIKEQASFSGSSYKIGCMNITVKLDDICKLLETKKNIFKGKYLLVLVDDGWNNLSWDGQTHLSRKVLYKKSHVMSTGNPSTIEFCSGKPSIQKYMKEFEKIKPCIHGSDTHNFEKFCKPDLDRFCWIKSEFTFEGLKQILYEPEERVRIQPLSPEYEKNIYSVKELNLENGKINSELELKDQILFLNQNLVTIIGGKGNGKTAIIDLIANCFLDRRSRKEKDRNSFIQRVEKDKPEILTKLIFKENETFEKKVLEDKFFDLSKITYLPQGKIEDLSGDIRSLHKQIKKIIQESGVIKESKLETQFDSQLKLISEFKEEINENNITIIKLEKETDENLKSELEKKVKLKEGELNNIRTKVKALSSLSTEESKNRVEKLKREEKDLRVKHSIFETEKEDLNKLNITFESFAQEMNKKISSKNIVLKKIGIEEEISYLDISHQIKSMQQIIKTLEKLSEKNRELIELKLEKINELNEIEKNHANIIGSKDNLEKEINLLKLEVANFTEKERKLGKLKRDRISNYIEILKNKFLLKEIYNQQIDLFSKGKDEILQGIDFESELKFNEEKFNKNADVIFDRRKLSNETLEEIRFLIKNVTSSEGDREDKIKQYLIFIFGQKENIKGKILNNSFYNFIFDNYFDLVTEVFFNGIKINKLSIGQKGTVLLKIFLAEGDEPLLIDQPEENLDNKFVYEDLVYAFREAKKKRQVIISTHNANLVINTDAEQIILANYENNKISYKSGTIENLDMRKEITTILEGGEEAFKRREEKYNIN